MTHDRDTLINRVVDDEATGEDWAALKELAARDATIWRDLAEAQYAHAELSAALEAAIEVADGVEAPAEDVLRWRFVARTRTLATWGGWAAAAALALAWLGGGIAPQPQGMRVGHQAGLPGTSAPASAADAFRQYMELGKAAGHVVGEIPDVVVVDSAPNPGGRGFEIIYIRQILERRVVEDIYRLGADELGRPVPVRIEVVRTGGGAM